VGPTTFGCSGRFPREHSSPAIKHGAGPRHDCSQAARVRGVAEHLRLTMAESVPSCTGLEGPILSLYRHAQGTEDVRSSWGGLGVPAIPATASSGSMGSPPLPACARANAVRRTAFLVLRHRQDGRGQRQIRHQLTKQVANKQRCPAGIVANHRVCVAAHRTPRTQGFRLDRGGALACNTRRVGKLGLFRAEYLHM